MYEEYHASVEAQGVSKARQAARKRRARERALEALPPWCLPLLPSRPLDPPQQHAIENHRGEAPQALHRTHYSCFMACGAGWLANELG